MRKVDDLASLRCVLDRGDRVGRQACKIAVTQRVGVGVPIDAAQQMAKTDVGDARRPHRTGRTVSTRSNDGARRASPPAILRPRASTFALLERE